MARIEKLIQRVQKTKHGFLDIQRAAYEVVDEQSEEESLRIAKQLVDSKIYQARSLATFICGRLAAKSKDALIASNITIFSRTSFGNSKRLSLSIPPSS